MIIYINAYLVGNAYGGPEEGGWWYDYGTPLASVPMEVADIKLAHETPEVIALKEKLIAMFKDQEWGHMHSAGGGEAVRAWVEEAPAAPYPEEKPHYE